MLAPVTQALSGTMMKCCKVESSAIKQLTIYVWLKNNDNKLAGNRLAKIGPETQLKEKPNTFYLADLFRKVCENERSAEIIDTLEKEKLSDTIAGFTIKGNGITKLSTV